MKKRGLLILILAFLFTVAIVSAADLSISSSILTEEVYPGDEVVFQLRIFNSNSEHTKFIISPDRSPGIFDQVVEEIRFDPEFIPIEILPGQKEDIKVILRLKEKLDPRVDYATDIKVKSIDGALQQGHRLVIDLKPFDKPVILNLKTSNQISPGKENLITIALKNRGPEFLEDLNVEITSEFFTESNTINIAQFRTEELEFPIRLSSNTQVGHYDLIVKVTDQKGKVVGEETFRYSIVENVDIKESVTKENTLFGTRNIVTKTNEGNSNVNSFYKTEFSTTQKIFTKTSPEPTTINEVDGGYEYEWEFNLTPNESYTIDINTNYINLAIILLIIISLIVGLFIWLNSGVLITKKVDIKDGTANILLHVKNNSRNGIKNLTVVDHLPKVVHPSKHYGHIKPDEIHQTKLGTRLVWKITHLAKGEERIISYKLEHKVNLFGKVALPSAMAIYHNKGSEVKSHSNKTFVEKKEQ